MEPITRGSSESNPRSVSQTSLSLLDSIRAQDRAAFAKVESLYRPYIEALGRKYRLGDADLSDVVQNVFAKVWSKIETFERDEPGQSFRRWLATITLNEIRTHFRNRDRRPQAIGGTDAQLQMHELPKPAVELDFDGPETPSEDRAVLMRAAESVRAQFELKTWQAFWETTIEGRSSPDVAADLGLTSGAVRQAKYKVLQALRREYGNLL